MPLNGYVRFLNANRERIKQENPDLTFAEITKKLAAEWSSMNQEEKKSYLDEAERAKEVYLKELHEYQRSESYQEFMERKQRAKQYQQMEQTQQHSSTMDPGSMISSPSSSSSQQHYPQQPPQQSNLYQQQQYNAHHQHQSSSQYINQQQYAPNPYGPPTNYNQTTTTTSKYPSSSSATTTTMNGPPPPQMHSTSSSSSSTSSNSNHHHHPYYNQNIGSGGGHLSHLNQNPLQYDQTHHHPQQQQQQLWNRNTAGPFVGQPSSAQHQSSMMMMNSHYQQQQPPNAALKQITGLLKNITKRGLSYQIESLSIMDLLPSSWKHYVTYEGSITQPACYETVQWVILNRPIYLSSYQFHMLRHSLKGDGHQDNFRPTQPRNKRSIRCNIVYENIGGTGDDGNHHHHG